MDFKEFNNITNALDETFFSSLRDKLVPACGAAQTVAGEIIRAMDRLIYRYWNDGDMVGQGYGNETCNSSYRYLYRKVGDKIPQLSGIYKEDEYLAALAEMMKNIKDFLTENPGLETWTNTEDSRTADPEDYEWDREEEEDEDGYRCDW
jgi:hypothetical protein